ncbi:hypothetical protein AXG93_969s1030 [Marchantia polymorpha subsp. ruderalis]|uniref:Uncharacterized protein n=1 Tax=Marchantia polymorpha subsp. ruderalis TaxID=1480154 RepID=A0A176W9H1_MARPO|nr:hypothetical protein AXG93_969s1030 [Marchantia polymorpha subsp. ruderalis]
MRQNARILFSNSTESEGLQLRRSRAASYMKAAEAARVKEPQWPVGEIFCYPGGTTFHSSTEAAFVLPSTDRVIEQRHHTSPTRRQSREKREPVAVWRDEQNRTEQSMVRDVNLTLKALYFRVIFVSSSFEAPRHSQLHMPI